MPIMVPTPPKKKPKAAPTMPISTPKTAPARPIHSGNSTTAKMMSRMVRSLMPLRGGAGGTAPGRA